ncbi:proline-rich receptor-like protein kinase PERK8 [Iris pallida]|uniref:Proline-rich receptor-like protein kinase PERK8 n=1 Tax=Iris pallida TaxID=29817 RepID=A0AAX6HUF0_IRIPA|nr:proline-rich receptor-like protein kinase PERK8 [Iris pallida]
MDSVSATVQEMRPATASQSSSVRDVAYAAPNPASRDLQLPLSVSPSSLRRRDSRSCLAQGRRRARAKPPTRWNRPCHYWRLSCVVVTPKSNLCHLDHRSTPGDITRQDTLSLVVYFI